MPDQTTTDKPRFVHLHLHSSYSLLDGGNRVDRLVKRVAELGMDAVAVTDHGNLHAAVEFYSAAKDAGIKPIMGIEAYVAPDLEGKTSDRTRREYTGMSDGGFHLVLLAETQQGWRNLLKLSSDAFINGFYFKPRMDKSTLTDWSEGLIAINGHLGSSIAHYMVKYEQTGDEKYFEAARKEAQWHVETFGTNDQGQPNFYLELQRHEEQLQNKINPHVIRLARELDIPLVCDNDAHFLHKEDYDAHDTLCCISMGKIKQDENRIHYPPGLYVKSPEEMHELFLEQAPEVPEDAAREALDNTVAIADRCHVELDFDANHAPVVKPVMGKRLRSVKATDPAKAVRAFASKHSLGGNEWLKDICSDITLDPFDEQRDADVTTEELKERCDEALRYLCEAGCVWRYGADGITDEIRARLERELKILADKLISAYFLIVWDFVNEARRRGIPCNARGSGVGTMVGYVLGLSNACPVKYGLLFERFTDPDRSEYPDIDIDICQDGRQEILEYVRQKYGYVAQIITFGTLKAKAAVRDVGRVFNIPLPEVDIVAKLIPEGPGVNLEKAMKQEPDLQELYNTNPQYKDLLDTAKTLEGMHRHAGIHAAAVVLATQPLDNIVPLYKASHGEDIPTVTQWDGPTCEQVGLLKMDFLGLRTLSIIQRCRELIEGSLSKADQVRTVLGEFGGGPKPDTPREFIGKKAGEAGKTAFDPLDLERLTFRDQNVLDLFRRGDTAGVFQFESGGMRNTLMGMKPDRLEDLIAANALFRPGPMELIPDYNDRKHGRAEVPAAHEIVEKFTDETYGILVYQEQIMQVVHELGGIPLREAYTLIKAISKKKEKTINACKDAFLKGAADKGCNNEQASELFDLILKFAGYGFNKSHSTGYAIVAYQTAFLKTYFPIHYMAALLTYEAVSTEKVVEYIDECRRVLKPDGTRGIEVKPPDINLSEIGFTVVYDKDEPHDPNHGHIRFGLNAVRGVGEKAIVAILKARQDEELGPFKSLFDFCERVSLQSCNRATIEALIKCGAFDSVHGPDSRAALLEALDGAIASGQRIAADREAGQMSFFDAIAGGDSDDGDNKSGGGSSAPAVTLPNVEPWKPAEQLKHEKEVLGFFVSSHPLDEHHDTIRRFTNATIEEAKQLAHDAEVIIGGMFTRVRPIVIKNGRSAGQKMAVVTIEDETGPMEGVIFSNGYAVAAPLIQQDAIVFIKGKVDRKREGEAQIRMDEVIPVEQAASSLCQSVKIVLRNPRRDGQPLNGEVKQLQNLLRNTGVNGSATANVMFEVHEDGHVAYLRTNVRVAPSKQLRGFVASVLQDDLSCCQLVGPPRLFKTKRVTKLLATDDNRPERLRTRGSQEENCASIDRY